MPKPGKNESKSDYIARAIPIFRKEGYFQDEAVGRAYGFCRSYYHKKRKAFGERGINKKEVL